MLKTGCGQKADALYALYHKKAMELKKLDRDWAQDERAELLKLQELYQDEIDVYWRHAERKQKRLAKGGTWAEGSEAR
ncbi:MAG: hypothetical protein AB1796_11815 [Bacillota bacterium]